MTISLPPLEAAALRARARNAHQGNVSAAVVELVRATLRGGEAWQEAEAEVVTNPARKSSKEATTTDST